MSSLQGTSRRVIDSGHARILLAAAITTVLIVGVLTLPPLIDDAYITFRYAQNLAEGRGLVFNAGEWVEGYSNLSWVLVAGAISRLALPLETTIRFVSLGSCTATIALMWLYARRRRLPLFAACGGVIAVACSILWLRSSMNGLEGCLVSLITAALLVMTVPSNDRYVRRGLGIGLLLVLAAITRPEGPFMAIAYLMGLGCQTVLRGDRQSKDTRMAWNTAAIAAFVLAVGWAVTLAWRYSTYHSLVPNSVLAKLGDQSLLSRPLWLYGFGLRYVGQFVIATAPLLVAAAGFVFSWQTTVASLPALALLVFGCLVPIPNGGDWMPEYRLLAPYICVAGVLTAEGLAATVGERARSRWAITGAVILLTAWSSWANIEKDPGAWGRRTVLFRPQRLWSQDPPSSFGELGLALSASTFAPEARVATEVLGEFGYYAATRYLIDLSGLTDRTIALEEPVAFRFGRKTRPRTLERLAPSMIIFNDFSYWETLMTHSWFAERYAPIICDRFYRDGLYAFVAINSALAAAGPIAPGCQTGGMAMRDAFANVRLQRTRRHAGRLRD